MSYTICKNHIAMKKSIYLCFAITIMSISCSENELFELSHDANEANTSYENQFKAIWTTIDMNYPIWDFERDEYGLDWDSIYCRYLPLFQKQDSIYKETGDTICWFHVQFLYKDMFKNLHDKHLSYKIKDVYSNKKADFLDLYSLTVSSQHITFHLQNKQQFLYQYSENTHAGHKLTDNMLNHKFFWWYGLFDDNIVYLHFPSFNLSEIIQKNDKTPDEQNILNIWQTWFDKVQELHYNGTLKGVILDIRHNNGGNSKDYQYLLGALHGDIDGCNTIRTGFYRGKAGIGRYDYGKFKHNGEDCVYNTYKEEHACVNAPIVLLADSFSASMAEQTCLAAKKIKNAYVIGTHTYGAFSPVSGEDSIGNHFTLCGNIGDPTLMNSSFYIKMPYLTFVSEDGTIIEGKGVEPDYEVFYDGVRDTQLDYALDFIDRKNKEAK